MAKIEPMGAPNTQREMAAELNRRLEQLHQELEAWNQALEEIWNRRKKRQRSPLDPFGLLERLIGKGLQLLEQAVSWLVNHIIR